MSLVINRQWYIWWHKPYLSFWLWLKKYLVTMDPYFGTLIPSNFVPWLLIHIACDTIDINDSFLDRWCAQVMPITQVPQASFIWLEGFKSLFEINSTIKVSTSWMRMDLLLKLLSKTWLACFLLSDKIKVTIRKAGQSSKKSYNKDWLYNLYSCTWFE